IRNVPPGRLTGSSDGVAHVRSAAAAGRGSLSAGAGSLHPPIANNGTIRHSGAPKGTERAYRERAITMTAGRPGPASVRERLDQRVVLRTADRQHRAVPGARRHLVAVPLGNPRIARDLIPRPFQPRRHRQAVAGSRILLVIEIPVLTVG